MEEIEQVLFLVNPTPADLVDEKGCSEECPLFTVKEVEDTVLSINDKNTPARIV